jgi:hypothetical protein
VSTANPTVGVCHDLTVPDEVDAVSDSRPPVSCTAQHTTETFAIGQVAGDLAEQPERPGQEQLEPLQAAACPIPTLRAFLAAGDRDGVASVRLRAYFPSRSDWKAGSRAIRCDVAIPAPHGALSRVTFDMASVMNRPQSSPLRICYRQAPAADDGWSTTGTQSTCDKVHSTQDINAWVDVPTSTPSAAEVQQLCDPYAREFLISASQSGGLRASGVVVRQSNGTPKLRCTVGGVSSGGTVEGSIAPR